MIIIIEGAKMISNYKDIYKNKRILITGHTGFKGSWLTLWLIKLGAEVIGYSLDPVNDYDNFNISVPKEKIIDIRGDIRDSNNLSKVFQNYSPDMVFHMAAQPLVKYSFENPKYTYEVNVIGTLNVLEAIKECINTKAAIIVTSDKCYKNHEWVWGYRESDTLGGYDPYSCSKACTELLVDSYRNSFLNLKDYKSHKKLIATVRAGNVIGGGDWSKDRIIPDSIKALQENRPIEIRNPLSIRPWQHVLEPLSGYIKLGGELLSGHEKYSGAWNFGPYSESITTVEDVVKKVINYYGSGSYEYSKNYTKSHHEANMLSLDISKAKYELHWNPKWGIDIAIEKTVEWYKNYKNEDFSKLCLNQIEEYEKD